jgi:membrane protease YdiL (CAAX protease family)
MTTLPDLLYVALFAVIVPLLDYAFFWPEFRRRAEGDPARARSWLYAWCIPSAWGMVAIGAAIWRSEDRPWAGLGFSVPHGWRLWVGVVLVLLHLAYSISAATALVRDAAVRASLRQQMGSVTGMMPRTRSDLYGFVGASLTAGFCEEFLFRGYFIRALAPWLGWWGAAALSLALFAGGHSYQGGGGAVRTAVVGALYTLVLAFCGSLWPGIVLHALVDVSSGIMAWLALREREAAP